jgi:hypothetical protein
MNFFNQLRNKFTKLGILFSKKQINSHNETQSTNSPIFKYRLMEVGLSNKPLEGSTIFGDTFSKADNQTILNYIKRKEIKAHEHVKFLTQGMF